MNSRVFRNTNEVQVRYVSLLRVESFSSSDWTSLPL
jgi:hypothetical protein